MAVAIGTFLEVCMGLIIGVLFEILMGSFIVIGFVFVLGMAILVGAIILVHDFLVGMTSASAGFIFNASFVLTEK